MGGRVAVGEAKGSDLSPSQHREDCHAFDSYDDSLQYDPTPNQFPIGTDDQYNSNGFASGLLGSGGATEVEPPPLAPGFNKPVPFGNLPEP